jgi:hypothetical protein
MTFFYPPTWYKQLSLKSSKFFAKERMSGEPRADVISTYGKNLQRRGREGKARRGRKGSSSSRPLARSSFAPSALKVLLLFLTLN